MSLDLHPLLKKQIDQLGLSPSLSSFSSQKWAPLIGLINKTYKNADQERDLLKNKATHDVLTNLPNRTLLIDRIQQAISIESRHGLSFGVLFFDLDRFKLINDSLSHQAGDKLLQAVANRLQATFRLEDTIARLGGDEFVMVALDLEKERSITHIATKLMDLFKYPFEIETQEIFISASVGISLYPKDGKTPEDLLNNADIAMYHAKELGNNHFQFYRKGLNKLAYARLKKENDLRRAIENKEFFLVYQPQFDLITREITSVEALIRWQHPEQGPLLPLDFIPTAEETGLIIPLGEWVINEACSQSKKWQEEGLPSLRMAVNVSNVQLKHPNFLEIIKNILHDTKLKAEYLEIELSENILISNPEILRLTKDLKKIGVQLALDDFGTGNSSLNYLKKIPIDHLKIDQHFVKNIGVDSRDEVIIQAIMDIANGLHYKTLAEGVETQDQLDFLKNRHCEGAQGYLLGKPMEAKEFKEFFKEFV